MGPPVERTEGPIAPAPLSLTTPDIPPELAGLQGYDIVKELGRGGMGVVYLARNKLMDRLEVLKVMNKSLVGQPEAVERFLREIRSAARLIHPNIVTAHSAHQLGDLLVLTMEYVEGEDLAKVVRTRGPLPVAHACFCVHQAATGLQRGHELGLVHRDVKPANLLLAKIGKRPVVKVIDFGLAKAKSEVTFDRELTGANHMMGTPGYSAPEQLNDAKNADTRSDIYALGCTLYYLLAGESPFKGNSALAVALAQEAEKVRPLRDLRPEVPEELEAVVLKMMAKHPAHRYGQPREVAAALLPFVQGDKASQKSLAAPRGVAEAPSRLPEGNAWPSLTNAPAARPPKKRSVSHTGRRRGAGRRPWPAILAGSAILFGLIVSGIVALRIRTANGTVASGNVPTDAEILSDVTDRLGAESIKPMAEPKKPPAKLPPRAVGERPHSLDCTGIGGASAAEVRKAQELWAKYLGRTVEETVEIAEGVPMTFVLIPPGKFRMGSPESEEGHQSQETLHTVTLSEPFDLGKYEVTQAQYAALATRAATGRPKLNNKDPSHFKGADLPVEQVNWEEANSFGQELTKTIRDNYLYRLPSESEWEYCCRGGRPTSYAFGIGDGYKLSSAEANFNGNLPYGGASKGPYLDKTSPVGSYMPNALGLYDMHGNVWEWCNDWFGPYPNGELTNPAGPDDPRLDPHRVARGGGCWKHGGTSCRAALRSASVPDYKYLDLGFRLARSIPSSRVVPPG
jgi:formylglycine-generating enzyme required for sulfatase activity